MVINGNATKVRTNDLLKREIYEVLEGLSITEY